MGDKQRVLVLLADGFEEVEAVTPVDFLRRAGLEVITLGVSGNPVTGARGISINADLLLDVFSGDYDAVVVPGGMPGAANIAASVQAADLIRKAYDEGKLVAAICAAPSVVLYPLGILDGKSATCYPGFEKAWTKVRFSEERVVIDGSLITSRGAGTAAEFSAAIIAYLLDDEAARDINSRTLQPGA